MDRYGLGPVASVWWTISIAVGWLVLMLLYSPVADRIASRFVKTPPKLTAFRPIQQSKLMLILGIVVAWVLGGFVEELIFRGIVLTNLEMSLVGTPLEIGATPIAIAAAAVGAGVLHFYQRLRAVIIVTQLSVLFGVLFVLSGRNLWACILCHGLYDTIGFIRFARGKSKYARLEPEAAGAV